LRRKLLRFVFWTISILLLLVVAVFFAINLPVVQQRITHVAETFLQQKLGTRVEVGAIRMKFPYAISLERFLLEDQKGDTLARIGSLAVTVDLWKILGQTIELQKVTLEDAAIYMQHRDSTYSFDFVVRAFSKSDTAAIKAPVDTIASAWKLKLDLTVLKLKQVHFLLRDDEVEGITQADIGSAETVLAKADLENLNFEFNGFSLADSDIRLIQKKKSPDTSKPGPNYGIWLKNADIACSHVRYETTEMTLDAALEKTQLDKFQLQAIHDNIAVQAQGVQVENSSLTYRDPVSPLTPGHFNAGDLRLTQLNAEIPDFSYQNDSLFVQADALSGNDQSGLQVHALRAIARVTPRSIDIKNALASFNQTSVDGDAVLFENDKATFDRMQVQLRQAKGMLGDLIILMPPQDNSAFSKLSDIPYEVSGKLNGWLQDLQTENIRLQAGSGTIANFSGSVQQLAELTKLGMHLNISRLETNRADLVRWMSVGGTPMDSLLLQPLPAHLSVSGNLNGSMAQLQLAVQGKISALQTGAAFPPAPDPPLLFNLSGAMSELNDPDKLGMDLQINQLDAPQNFFDFLALQDAQFPDLLQATGSLKGTLSALHTDLKFNALRGQVSSQLTFNGLLKNLRTPELLGFDVHFGGSLARQETLGYVPDTMITQVLYLPDFVQLNGTAQGMVHDATAKIGIGLSGLGDIYVDAMLCDSSYQVDLTGKNLLISRLAVDTSLNPLKMLSLHAQISGEGFQFGETARIKLAGTFDSLIWDNLILRDIVFDADINGKQFACGVQSPDERVAVRARVSGDLSLAQPKLETDISINCMDLRAFGWANRPTTVCMHIFSSSAGLSMDTLLAKIRIEDIDLQYDTVHIHPGNLVLNVKLDNRNNRFNMVSDWLTGTVEGYFSPADLPKTIAGIAEQYFVVDRTAYMPRVGTDSLSVDLHLLRSEVLTSGIVPGLIELGPVDLEGALVATRNDFNLRIQAPRIVYRDWDIDSLHVRAYAGDSAALFVLTTPLVKRAKEDFIENAVLNGRFLANIADVSFKASNDEGRERFLLVSQAKLNHETQEALITLAPRQVVDYKEWAVNPENQIRIAPGGVTVRNFTLKGDGQSIQVEGETQKLAGNKTGLNFAVDIDRLNYNNFDIFTAGVLTELGGWTDAHVKISGRSDALQVRGNMQLHETYFTPTLTNVRYQLSETPIQFTESGIALDGLTLRDPYGKTLGIKGKLTTSDWSNIQSDLKLHADRWQVMNSTKQQNPVYYGELYVSLDGTVRGPISQPDVQLVLKTAKESTFTYVYDAATQVLQHEGIVYFLPPPRQYVRPPVYDAPVNVQPFTLSASVEIDSNLTISSVVNPVTGDDFQGRATGKLQFDLFSNGNMTLAGQVELVRGVYNYSYQSVVKRSFEVTTGSTIIWTGDPYTPELNLKARYQFKASPYPLVVNQLSSASAEEAAMYRKTQTFFLQTTLSGSATNPDVSFQFIYPTIQQQGSLSTGFGTQQSGLVESALTNVNQDKNLLSRQVFGVLLLRNFIGETVSTSTSIGGANPLQSGLSSFLTSQINALADQYLTWIDVDLSTTEGSTKNGSNQADGTTNYQLRLQKSFFEDRLTFKISGGTTVGGANSSDVHSALENASIEYALTPDGVFKVTVFSESGFELLNASSSNLRNSGAGLILTKEFGGKK
jgi:hypothetical protein